MAPEAKGVGSRCGHGWFPQRPLSPQRRLPVPVCVLIASSYEDSGRVGLGPSPKISFNCHPFFKAPVFPGAEASPWS